MSAASTGLNLRGRQGKCFLFQSPASICKERDLHCLSSLPLPSVCLPPSLHFSQAEASMDPLAPLLSSVTWSALRTLWTPRVGVGRERKGSSWWDAARQQQQAPLETAPRLTAGDNPPLGHDKTAPQPPNPPGSAGAPRGAGRPQPCQWGWGLLHARAADERSVQPGPNAGEACGLDTWQEPWAPQPEPWQESGKGGQADG